MNKENNISVERMIELENFLLDNYPLIIPKNLDNIYSLFLSNFSYDEAKYLYYSYIMPYQEILDDLYYYWNTRPQLDELKFISYLSLKYNVDNQFVLKRILDVKKIRKILIKNSNVLKSTKIEKFNKLVRDNIPSIIEINNEIPIYRILNDKEYWESLLNKLDEEKQEVSMALTKEDRKKELADCLELIKAMAEFNGFTLSEIEEERDKKERKNGSFSRRIYLEKVITKKTIDKFI